jgi:hypothetical protein
MSELTVEQIENLLASNRKAKVELEDKVKGLESDLKVAKRKAEVAAMTPNATISKNYEVQFGSSELWTREFSQGDRVHVRSDWGGITVTRLTDGKDFKLGAEYFRLDGQVDPNPDDVHMVTYLGGKSDCGLQLFKGQIKTTQKWAEVTCPRCKDKQ